MDTHTFSNTQRHTHTQTHAASVALLDHLPPVSHVLFSRGNILPLTREIQTLEHRPHVTHTHTQPRGWTHRMLHRRGVWARRGQMNTPPDQRRQRRIPHSAWGGGGGGCGPSWCTCRSCTLSHPDRRARAQQSCGIRGNGNEWATTIMSRTRKHTQPPPPPTTTHTHSQPH